MAPRWLVDVKKEKFACDIQLGIFHFVIKTDLDSLKRIRPAFVFYITLLKPTGHVMHQQFNIQQLYVLPTLYLCVLYLSESKQRLVPLTA